MGAAASKPDGASKHVVSSNTPVQFSQELVDSLQASSETNSSRAKSLELHIAQRVAAELAALQKKEDSTLSSLRETISSSESSFSSSTSSSSSSPADASSDAPRLLDLPSVPRPHDAAVREDARQGQSSAQVFAELEKLKKGLSARKQLREMPREVERAREEVVRCLKLNDRRPLDCWREVEAFKGSVGRMEEEFIERVL